MLRSNGQVRGGLNEADSAKILNEVLRNLGGRPKKKGTAADIHSGGVEATINFEVEDVQSDYAPSDELHTASETKYDEEDTMKHK